jgi:hypothetical protein
MSSLTDWFASASVEKLAALTAVVGYVAFGLWRAVLFLLGVRRRRIEADADQWLGEIEDAAKERGGTTAEVSVKVKTRRDRRRARVLVERGRARL